MATSRFDFYERVRIATTDSAKSIINGESGAVLGKACGEDGQWTYAVLIYSLGRIWSCWEYELVTTGEFDRRENFETGQSIRVSQRGEVRPAD